MLPVKSWAVKKYHGQCLKISLGYFLNVAQDLFPVAATGIGGANIKYCHDHGHVVEWTFFGYISICQNVFPVRAACIKGAPHSKICRLQLECPIFIQGPHLEKEIDDRDHDGDEDDNVVMMMVLMMIMMWWCDDVMIMWWWSSVSNLRDPSSVNFKARASKFIFLSRDPNSVNGMFVCWHTLVTACAGSQSS